MTEISVERRPHDEFLKNMLFEEPMAKDFFESNLPSDMLNLVKLDNMQLVPGTLIDKELRALHTDILYKVEMKEGSEGYIFLLVEHYSTPDPTMAFRTLNYVMRILDRHVKEAKNAGKNPLPLPYVFPLVYYNGEKSYKGERYLFSLFGEHKERVMQLFNGPLNLVDISLEAGKDLRGQKRASLLSWCMRYSMEREFLSHLSEFGQYAEDLMLTSRWTEADGDRAKVMLEYMLRSLNASADNEAFIEAVYNTLPSELGDTMATFAEQLFEEGKIEGKHETVAGTLKAIHFIKAGWDSVAISEETKLELNDVEELRKEIID
ncbi:MAG: putative transposase [Gammaproteobacteria bacterium]|jgi:predicted transposase YdaD|nr:putative transposase [Gammaproteobacteria bacterium]